MKVDKKIINEICKLNKNEWENLKTNIDFLYALEEKEMKKKLYLTPKDIEKKLKLCPVPIQILSE